MRVNKNNTHCTISSVLGISNITIGIYYKC